MRTRAGWTEQPGALIDGDGVVVGEHRGAAAYTVGQRQGLGVALGEPRYVSSIDAGTNIVTLGRREDLYRSEFELESASFVAGRAPADRSRLACASGTARRRCPERSVAWAMAVGR